ncbi:MAG TPA: HNH endonuclease signature motif containing protein [Candidatus Acidoferrales bacterium]|nr:HNH endonuclease signature motif containing protein [Candidatus Acidoferrales bacterium]
MLIALLFVIAAMIYLSRTSYSPKPAKISIAPGERAGPADIYPIAALTPGATNPAITQSNIGETICNPHWSTKSIRPPEEYTYRLKREQIGEYHDSDTKPADYEEDHLIPLELGGNPTDPKNLWPEAYSTSIPDGGAKYKDRVEDYLHREVCSRAMPLAEAQQRIASDWYSVYVSSVR